METTMEAAQAVALKDYIINLPDAIAKGDASYEVVLANNTDFIVKRKTQTKERELVILISQGLYYIKIKDCKSEAVEPITKCNLRSFLRYQKDNMLPMEQVHWLKHLCKEAAEYIIKVISSETLVDMCRHQVMADMKDPDWFAPYWEEDSKLFLHLFKLYPSITDRLKFQASFPIIYWLKETYGDKEALYFAERLVKSGIQCISLGSHYFCDSSKEIDAFIKPLDEDYGLEIHRFTDYLLFDLLRQGYTRLDRAFLTSYYYYLSMQKTFFGEVREKYPEHFKYAYDVIILKKEYAYVSEKCDNFAKQSEEIQNLAYQGERYCIVIPTQPNELADEGVNLGYSVDNYMSRVESGECCILFLRQSDLPGESLVTLLLDGKRICEAQGLNCRSITEEERQFLDSWGEEKGIEITV